mmetsp:Transcript_41606/g.120118  ORF Transcript_41606/g.120118 Transcript_41606/m.120118 type:complete len:655 (-) Transcript_41606:102-2066(-)
MRTTVKVKALRNRAIDNHAAEPKVRALVKRPLNGVLGTAQRVAWARGPPARQGLNLSAACPALLLGALRGPAAPLARLGLNSLRLAAAFEVDVVRERGDQTARARRAQDLAHDVEQRRSFETALHTLTEGLLRKVEPWWLGRSASIDERSVKVLVDEDAPGIEVVDDLLDPLVVAVPRVRFANGSIGHLVRLNPTRGHLLQPCLRSHRVAFRRARIDHGVVGNGVGRASRSRHVLEMPLSPRNVPDLRASVDDQVEGHERHRETVGLHAVCPSFGLVQVAGDHARLDDRVVAELVRLHFALCAQRFEPHLGLGDVSGFSTSVHDATHGDDIGDDIGLDHGAQPVLSARNVAGPGVCVDQRVVAHDIGLETKWLVPALGDHLLCCVQVACLRACVDHGVVAVLVRGKACADHLAQPRHCASGVSRLGTRVDDLGVVSRAGYNAHVAHQADQALARVDVAYRGIPVHQGREQTWSGLLAVDVCCAHLALSLLHLGARGASLYEGGHVLIYGGVCEDAGGANPSAACALELRVHRRHRRRLLLVGLLATPLPAARLCGRLGLGLPIALGCWMGLLQGVLLLRRRHLEARQENITHWWQALEEALAVWHIEGRNSIGVDARVQRGKRPWRRTLCHWHGMPFAADHLCGTWRWREHAEG